MPFSQFWCIKWLTWLYYYYFYFIYVEYCNITHSCTLTNIFEETFLLKMMNFLLLVLNMNLDLKINQALILNCPISADLSEALKPTLSDSPPCVTTLRYGLMTCMSIRCSWSPMITVRHRRPDASRSSSLSPGRRLAVATGVSSGFKVAQKKSFWS